jgi:hypothetical protein
VVCAALELRVTSMVSYSSCEFVIARGCVPLFEYDAAKSEANKRKHAIELEEAQPLRVCAHCIRLMLKPDCAVFPRSRLCPGQFLLKDDHARLFGESN